MIEYLYKNFLCGKVLPLPGSVVKVGLWGNFIKSACHTGIYVGNNQIVEMTNENGCGVINKVSPEEFFNHSRHRTGRNIYVAAVKVSNKYIPLADQQIAERAMDAVGRKSKYNLLSDNCHLFTRYCITGERDDTAAGTLENVEFSLVSTLAEKYPGGTIGDDFFEALQNLKNYLLFGRYARKSGKDLWRSTGIKRGDMLLPEKTCWRCGGTGKFIRGNTTYCCDLCCNGGIIY